MSWTPWTAGWLWGFPKSPGIVLGFPNHTFGGLRSQNTDLCWCVFLLDVFHENEVRAYLFCMARDLACALVRWCWHCWFRLPDSVWLPKFHNQRLCLCVKIVKLPTGVPRHMTPLERELEAVDGISLQQLDQPVAEVVGRVSVVTPTTASRARFHPQLWQCFVDQSWPNKELVVVETYHDEPSAFFQSIARIDKRLKYVAIKRPVGEDLTVGAKRNATILLASGQYIVNFDDDDLYADRYVEHMVTQMQRRNLVAMTLSGWHNFFEARGSAGYSEPSSWDPEDQNEMDEILYGYGFSYVHLRVMAVFYPYPNLAFAEDAPFMLKLRQKTGRVGLMEDVDGLCLHIVHSTSSTPDPEISHKLTEDKLDGLVVSECRAYDCFMDNYSTSFSWFTGIFTSLFQFWSCWSDLRTCRSDQLIWLDFTNSQFHHGFCFSFISVTMFAKCSLKVGKETTDLSLEGKFLGRESEVAMFERL